MKIITYNVNGIRSAVQKGFLDWLSLVAPDIICIQETKAQPDQIPVFELAAVGYQSFIHSAVKRGYSGVAIFTKITPDHVEYGIGVEKYDFEGRVIRADFGDISVMSVYHPSGTTGEIRQAFKMEWLADFSGFIQQLRQTRPNLILCGDYNICHKPIDIHDPVGNARSSGFLPEEREWLSGFIQNGFIDTFRHFNPQPHNYTWWSFRMNARERNLGWRIDYNMVTTSLENKIQRAYILPQAKHSDHCPAVLEIDI
jgi:exodeoxyribonuclease III